MIVITEKLELMMRNGQCYRITCALLVLLSVVIEDSSAGDLTYTAWEDEEENLWVRIVNGRVSKVRIEEIVIVFYDKKGKPIDQRNYPCSADCALAQNDARDFLLEGKPQGADAYQVRNIRFR
ncbi:MAG TPA: hypothetical protein VJ521_08805, partial [Acidobacteriota bacterium]|nr:hypothetical protein [Acidobacteriota bacterium]